MTMCGFGFGFFNTPNNRAIITSAPPPAPAGPAACRRPPACSGQTLGAALVALVFGLFPTHGTTMTLVVAGSVSAFAACVSLTRVAAPGRREAR